jgi:uncharacterized protein (DUF885 family)
MSLLKNILKPFVEFNKEEDNELSPKEGTIQQKNDDENNVSTIDNTAITNATNSTPAVSAAQTSSRSSNIANTAASSEYHKYFENLIEEANAKNPMFQGTDFKEFIDSKIDVEAIADEATRYKTAFNVLKRTGLTKERLVTTGQQYMQLIDQDLKGFADAYNQQYKNDVEQKEQLLQKKAEELKALNDKIATLNGEMQQLSQQVVQSKEKLNNNKNAFITAGQQKRKEIEIELQKINQYF